MFLLPARLIPLLPFLMTWAFWSSGEQGNVTSWDLRWFFLRRHEYYYKLVQLKDLCAWTTSVLSSNSRRLKFKRTASLCVSVGGCTTVCLKWGQWEVGVAEERQGGVDAGHGRLRMTAGACGCRRSRRSLSSKMDGFGSEEAEPRWVEGSTVRRH